jgi:hypothetical protein
VAGDIDGDGDVDFVDRDLFVAVLIGLESNSDYISRSDLNNDDNRDGLDVAGMTSALLGG